MQDASAERGFVNYFDEGQFFFRTAIMQVDVFHLFKKRVFEKLPVTVLELRSDLSEKKYEIADFQAGGKA